MVQSPFHNVKFWPVEFDMDMWAAEPSDYETL